MRTRPRNPRFPLRTAVACAVFGVLCVGFFAAAQDLGASPSWAQFRGPERNGVCRETGLLQSWPEGGPRLLWKTEGIGTGYSSPAIVDGRIYITGDIGEELIISALNATGEPVWRAANGRSWEKPFPGARSGVTVDGGRIFHMNAHGRAVCLNPADGREDWAVACRERFDADNIEWGMSECLLVDGNRVIVSPGGRKAFMAALDRFTGETVWATEPLRFQRTVEFGGKAVDPPRADSDRAGYASPILFRVGERRLLATASARHYVLADPDAGTLLWSYEVPARFEVIGSMAQPVGDGVFFTAPDCPGQFFRVAFEGDDVKVAEAWRNGMDNCHGAFVFADGVLVGSGYRAFRGWTAIDPADGSVSRTAPDWTKGAPLYADGRWYAQSENGDLRLLELTDEGFAERGMIRIPRGKQQDVWAHPAICGKRLYVRSHDTLFCYDIGREGDPK